MLINKTLLNRRFPPDLKLTFIADVAILLSIPTTYSSRKQYLLRRCGSTFQKTPLILTAEMPLTSIRYETGAEIA